MQTAENILNHIKSAYIWVIDQIEAHPHWVLWIALAYVAVRR